LPVAASSAAVEHARAAPAARASAVDALHGLPAEDARDALVDLVRDEVMHVLRLGPNDRPQRSARLMDLGVDSLMAVELKKRLHDAIGGRHDLPATLIFDFPTIDAVAEHLQRLLGLGVGDARPPQPAEQSGRAEVARLEGLSEQELESLLLDKLGQL
jgi:acyl carrier protein